jgi:hypothetical protein
LLQAYVHAHALDNIGAAAAVHTSADLSACISAVAGDGAEGCAVAASNPNPTPNDAASDIETIDYTDPADNRAATPKATSFLTSTTTAVSHLHASNTGNVPTQQSISNLNNVINAATASTRQSTSINAITAMPTAPAHLASGTGHRYIMPSGSDETSSDSDTNIRQYKGRRSEDGTTMSKAQTFPRAATVVRFKTPRPNKCKVTVYSDRDNAVCDTNDNGDGDGVNGDSALFFVDTVGNLPKSAALASAQTTGKQTRSQVGEDSSHVATTNARRMTIASETDTEAELDSDDDTAMFTTGKPPEYIEMGFDATRARAPTNRKDKTQNARVKVLTKTARSAHNEQHTVGVGAQLARVLQFRYTPKGAEQTIPSKVQCCNTMHGTCFL